MYEYTMFLYLYSCIFIHKSVFNQKNHTQKSRYEVPSNIPYNMDDDTHDFLKMNIKDAIPIEEGKLNSFGLDLTDPNYIGYTRENISIEIIGGIRDQVLASLTVTLSIRKIGSPSPLHVYRAQSVDLFNDNQVEYTIRQTSLRLEMEQSRVKHILYDCIERLDVYRRHKGTLTQVQPVIDSAIKKQASEVLKSNDIIAEIEGLLEQAGIVDIRLGLQVYILSLSRLTNTPLHTIIQGNHLLCHELVKQLLPIFPQDELREVTSISKQALSYPPYAEYWNDTILVLHQLESISKDNHVLCEYLTYGSSKRIVTEPDTQTGAFRSGERRLEANMSLLSYSSADFHPVFKMPRTILLPIQKASKLKSKLQDEHIRQSVGLDDQETRMKAQQVLSAIQSELQAQTVRNPLLEEIDLTPFFGSDYTKLVQYLTLVEVITMLHQKSLGFLGGVTPYIETKAEHMLLALELFESVFVQTEDELPLNLVKTFTTIKRVLVAEYKENHQTATFKVKEMRPHSGLTPGAFARHIKKLEAYNRITRTGGNNKSGFDYMVKDWLEKAGNTEAYSHLKKQLFLLSNSEVSPKRKAS